MRQWRRDWHKQFSCWSLSEASGRTLAAFSGGSNQAGMAGGARFLANALLGHAVEGLGKTVQGIVVARSGALGRLTLDLHLATLLHRLDELRLHVRLFDEGAFFLG